MEVLIGLAFPVMFLAGIGGAVIFGVNMHNQTQEAWRQAGKTLGVTHSPGSLATPPRLQGTVKTLFVEVTTIKKGSGDNNTTYTQYRIHHPPAGPPMTLVRQHALSGITRIFAGRKDVLVGDAVFDKTVVIDTDDPTAVAAFLNPTRRMAVMSLLEHWDHASVSERLIEVHRKGTERSTEALVANVHRLVDMGLLMSAPNDVDVALQMQAQGDLAQAADALHEINDTYTAAGSPNSFSQLLEAEARVAMGQGHEAHVVLASIDEDRVDPEIRAWDAFAQSQPAPPHAPLPSPPEIDEPSADVDVGEEMVVPEPPALPESATALDQASVIADLFESNRMGYEVEERFLEAYEGTTVTWTGRVDRMRAFATDSDFGRTPGIKATVEIGQIGDGRLVSNRIHAVVQLPEDAAVARGDEIRFRGTFTRVDRYMRNLFVAHGQLAD